MTAPDDFEAWMAREIAENGGVEFGADYRHWALKGYRAALEAVLSTEPAAQGEGWADESRKYLDYRLTQMADGGPLAFCADTLRDAASWLTAERVPGGEVRLWDTQWMNIVNHDNCYRDWDKADAINHAVKMTEQAIARNVADGKLPSARIAASPAPSESEGGKGVGS